MGCKKVKAIVIAWHKLPPLHDRNKVIAAAREYGNKFKAEPAIAKFATLGTPLMGDMNNYIGGAAGQQFR